MNKSHNKKPNGLLNEKSPYLLQHAYNPVRWLPWGEDAFRLAKEKDLPVFLSIGYSTCHWCHVMERESFENEDVARFLNENFVSVKVDREERPDLDAIYMEATQALSGTGGWPMSVWLTPDKKPFYAGTYFPPEDSFGRPGFKTLLKRLTETWKEKRTVVTETADQLTDAIRQAVDAQTAAEDLPDYQETLKNVLDNLSSNFDPIEGGFGPPPKFPMPTFLRFLLLMHGREKNARALEMAELTLQKMIQGGIFDQLGGGFSRYSTDALWLVPHFEKMLYDNAQLCQILADLFRITGKKIYREALEKTVSYLLRDLKHKEGGFFSAEDADSEGVEGKFYVWKLMEVRNLLGEDLTPIASFYFDLSPNGNFHDPHTRELGNNVLTRKKTAADTADKFGLSEKEAEEKILKIEETLLTARNQRPRPGLDDKILSGWNGLMIGSLADAGAALGRPEWIHAAEKAAHFLQARLYDQESGVLFKRWRDGERKIEGHQSDYAYLTQGLIRLFEANGHFQWLNWAKTLHQKHNALFYDSETRSYFMTPKNSDAPYRPKEKSDNVLPSGPSIAAWNGFKIGLYYGDNESSEIARNVLRGLGKLFRLHPTAVTEALWAFDMEAKGNVQMIIGGDDSSDKERMTQIARRAFFPNKSVLSVNQEAANHPLAQGIQAFSELDLSGGQATGYFCSNFTCEQPETSLKGWGAKVLGPDWEKILEASGAG